MILESITLHNFGVYKGRQTIDLTPRKNRPIILFGGLNGNGKTTLLDALQLSLYGQLAKTSNRGNLAYEKYLRKCINRSVPPEEGAALELKFRHTVEGQEHCYQIQRSWAAKGKTNTVQERMTVLRDEVKNSLLTETWDEYVQGLIPSQIAGLFFFDGEKIAEIADTETSSDFLQSAIQSLLGLDIVDRLKADLLVLEKRYKKEISSDTARKEIEAKEAELQSIEAARDRAHQEMGAGKTKLEEIEREVSKAEKQYRKHGGTLFDQRSNLKVQRARIDDRLGQTKNHLRELAAGSLPLQLLRRQLEIIRKKTEKEVEAKRNALLLNELKARDEKLLESLKAHKLKKDDLKIIEEEMADDRRFRTESTKKTAIIFDATQATVASLSHLLSKDLPQAKQKAETLVEEGKSIQAERDDLDRQLQSIPDPEAIKDLSKHLREIEFDRDRQTGKLEALESEYFRLLAATNRVKGELKKLYHNHVATLSADEEVLRILETKKRLQAILEQFKKRVADSNLAKLENLILESFQGLMRKEGLVIAVEIDRRSFELRMIGKNGSEILPERLSAGERQLLAVSMLWGLAKASGRPLPTVIDTPLGRLDSTHRKYMVDRYFPNASHQVILLSTDEEIDETFYSAIQNRLGRSYELIHDNKSHTTTVKQGYFWKTTSK
ncbi:MAG: DNA sulfur modification protein DndD [Verrucomicrobiales bacterium]|nr:DNA sulfur modification protein DndD [Verrucomicrobiales bacterium]